MVALQAWSQFPQRISALILAATSPTFGHGSENFAKQFLAQRLSPLDNGMSMAQIADVLIPAMARPGSTVAECPGLARARDCMAAIAPATYRAALTSLVSFEQRATLPTINVPTLCLAAEHDKVASPSVVLRMAEQIPGAQFVQLPDAGHLLNFERPDAFNALLTTFLATLDE